MKTLALISMMALPVGAEYAKLDNARVYYSVAGKGEPTVVLVHGWTCDGTFWDKQVPELAKNYRVLNVDLPGHGKSDAPEVEYTMELMARGVLAAMDAAKVGRAVLMGHSMGVSVNRVVYDQAPSRVAAFATIDGAIFRNSSPAFEAGFRKVYSGFDGPDGPALRVKFIEQMFEESTPPELREHIRSVMLAPPGRVAKSALAGLVASHIWDKGAVSVPALAINKKRQGDAMERTHRSVLSNLDYHEMDGVSHFLMMEKPAEFNAILTSFLGKAAAK